MKKNLLKAVVVLVAVVAGLNIKWLTAPRFGTHFSIAQSLATDAAEKQFLTPDSIKESLNYYINHKFTATCDIVENYDNVVVVEYKGNQFKVNVKDRNNYNNATKADVTFKTGKSLKEYQVTDIKPEWGK